MGKSKQSSGGAELPVTIVVEARTDQAVKNLDSLTAANQRAEQAAAKSAVTFRTEAEARKAGALESFVLKARAENAAAAQEKLAVATEKVGKAAHKTGSLTKVLGSQVHNLAVGQSSFTQALNMTLSVLGPWGIAIGVATTAIGHFIGDQIEASKAAEEHTKKIREQRRELQGLAADAALVRLKTHTSDRQRGTRRAQLGGGEIDAERAEIEEAIATTRGMGINTSALESELVGLKARELEIEKELVFVGVGLADVEARRAANAEAAVIEQERVHLLRQDELRVIEEQARRENSITGSKREQLGLTLQELEAFEKQIRAQEKLFLAQHDPSAKFFALEKANVKDERFARPGVGIDDKNWNPFANERQEALDKIEAESKARIKAREDALDAAAERSKKRHEDEIKRQNELLEKQEASGKMMGETVSGLASAWLSAGDLSAKGFRKVLAAWGKAESIKLGAVALSEGVQALVSAAFFNFPQAALHGAAAAQAAATAVVIAGMTGAIGGFGSISKNPKGGFGGSMFGGGAGGGDPDGQFFVGGRNNKGEHTVGRTSTNPFGGTAEQASNSQKDQLATAGGNVQLAQAGGGKGSAVINYNFAAGSIQSLGAIDEQTGLKLAQGIKKAEARLGGLQK